jgi:pimeloyl-ACP methyl ester carboxylesterase
MGERLLLAAVLILVTLVGGCAGLPDKQTVRLDDYDIAYAKSGAGNPAVVFEAGFGSNMDVWKEVFEPAAQATTVFAYDRKAVGDSHRGDNSEMTGEVMTGILDAVAPGAGTAVDVASAVGAEELPPRDGAVIVDELHRLLASLNIPPPYILVGHSLGGTYVELYARTYPRDIAGLVLVDPRRADFTARCKEVIKADSCDLPGWLLHMLPDSMVAEYRGFETSAALMRAAGPLPQVPMVVITAYNGVDSFPPEQKELWLASHKELVREVPHAQHIVLRESGHFVQRDQPQVVIDAILSVVRQSRTRVATHTTGPGQGGSGGVEHE